MNARLIKAVALLSSGLFPLTIVAEGPRVSARLRVGPAEEPSKIAAPVFYSDLMLVVASRDGIAAFVFEEEVNVNEGRKKLGEGKWKTENGVKYVFRYLDTATGKQTIGNSIVVEKGEYQRTADPNRDEGVDIGS